jgi:hypothetical protein
MNRDRHLRPIEAVFLEVSEMKFLNYEFNSTSIEPASISR